MYKLESLTIFYFQIATHPGYYHGLVEESSGQLTLASEEIERDLHRWVLYC